MVSGSSGQLKFAAPSPERRARTWPGQVFENPALTYEAAMAAYVAARNAASILKKPTPDGGCAREADATGQGALRHQEEVCRTHRRQIRQVRQQEDGTWRSLRLHRRAEQAAWAAWPKTERRRLRAQQAATAEVWAVQRADRRALREQRKAEDGVWRDQRRHINDQRAHRPRDTTWIAILVIVDNLTRRCFGLPLFVAGLHVTAEQIVAALQALLPPELHYLIADRGGHFRAKVMEALADAQAFVRVMLAPHRPQSNGIAERFVRTLKEWLSQYEWQTPEELVTLLHQFLLMYNDRPHQGKELKGLSPNEFDRQIQSV